MQVHIVFVANRSGGRNKACLLNPYNHRDVKLKTQCIYFKEMCSKQKQTSLTLRLAATTIQISLRSQYVALTLSNSMTSLATQSSEQRQ